MRAGIGILSILIVVAIILMVSFSGTRWRICADGGETRTIGTIAGGPARGPR